MRLTVNMRVQQALSGGQASATEVSEFASYLLRVGNGEEPSVQSGDSTDEIRFQRSGVTQPAPWPT